MARRFCSKSPYLSKMSNKETTYFWPMAIQITKNYIWTKTKFHVYTLFRKSDYGNSQWIHALRCFFICDGPWVWEANHHGLNHDSNNPSVHEEGANHSSIRALDFVSWPALHIFNLNLSICNIDQSHFQTFNKFLTTYNISTSQYKRSLYFVSNSL